jgi:hypothetical protein
MPRIFVQSIHGMPWGTSAASAVFGFQDMGAEIVPFSVDEGIPKGTAEDMVVGGVGSVRHRLHELGCAVPSIDYPESLQSFLGRKVGRTTINAVSDHPESWPVFVKPVEEKRFTGRLVKSAHDLIGCGTCGENPEVFCSEPVSFVAEWRCFVLRGQILDVRRYRGAWDQPLDPAIVRSAIHAYDDAPQGYAADFGLAEDGRTLLVEVNDGYALGSYGLEPHAYAHLLAARWYELVSLPDPFDFGPLPEPLL